MLFYTNNTFAPINSDIGEADVIFLGIPYTDGAISGYTKFGPTITRESLKVIEDTFENKHLFDKIKICDIGDLEIAPGSYKENEKRILSTINEIRNQNKKAMIIIVGGNHTITLPISKAISPSTVVQLDAHADLRENYLDSKYMQQTWAYHTSEFTKIIQIGTRSVSAEDHLDRAEQINTKNLSKLETLARPIHLTLDMDVFDPSLVEVGFPEPDGLTAKDVFEIIKTIKPETMDIVEISDNKLPSKTGYLAAHSILKAMSTLINKNWNFINNL